MLFWKVIFIFVLLTLSQLVTCHSWTLELPNTNYKLDMDDEIKVPFNITNTDGSKSTTVTLELLMEDPYIADFEGESHLNLNYTLKSGHASSSFHIRGLFLGRTRILAILHDGNESHTLNSIDITVVRKQRIIDQVFTVSVAILVSLIYVNFGCALNWCALKPILKRPIGPVIGFIGQYLVLPLFSYAFGCLLFPDRADMRLGLLFVGVSPAGGASNIWTYVLDGNIDLSLTMTTITTLAAFGMMPLWLFTLGPSVFEDARIAVPYAHIASLAAALFIPLLIGWFIQYRFPRVSALLVRILKGFSALLIIFIIIFATITNFYLFHLFSWRIILVGALLPWCGFGAGAALAFIARLPMRDLIAIAIESGIENTGIAIFLLRFSLPQPQADLTTVVPVAVAIVTPIPLAIFYLYKRFCGKVKDSASFSSDQLVNVQR